jgi:hypothetical protein
MVIYEAGPLELTDGRIGIRRMAGMKLRERIVIPASVATNYKNTAFLRVVLPYLDGFF